MNKNKVFLFAAILGMLLTGCNKAASNSESSQSAGSSPISESTSSEGSSSSEKSESSSSEEGSSSSEASSEESSSEGSESSESSESSSSSEEHVTLYTVSINGAEAVNLSVNEEMTPTEGLEAEYIIKGVNLVKNGALRFYADAEEIKNIGPYSPADEEYVTWVGTDGVYEKLQMMKDVEGADLRLQQWGDGNYSVSVDPNLPPVTDPVVKLSINHGAQIDLVKSEDVPSGLTYQYQCEVPAASIVKGAKLDFEVDGHAVSVKEDAYPNNVVVNEGQASIYMDGTVKENLYFKISGEESVSYTVYMACPADPAISLKGTFNGWRTGLAMTSDGDNRAILLNYEIETEQSVKVKIAGAESDEWFGYVDLDSGTDVDGLHLVNDEGAVKLPAGAYNIYVNNSNKLYIEKYVDPSKVYYPVPVYNGGFEQGNEGWSSTGFSNVYVSSGKGVDGSKALKTGGTFDATDVEAEVYQEIAGLQAGDKIRLSLSIATHWNDSKSYFSDLALFAGQQKRSCTDVEATTSTVFVTSHQEITLAEGDFVDGVLKLGVKFVPVNKYDSYFDNFTVEVQGHEYEKPALAPTLKVNGADVAITVNESAISEEHKVVEYMTEAMDFHAGELISVFDNKVKMINVAPASGDNNINAELKVKADVNGSLIIKFYDDDSVKLWLAQPEVVDVYKIKIADADPAVMTLSESTPEGFDAQYEFEAAFKKDQVLSFLLNDVAITVTADTHAGNNVDSDLKIINDANDKAYLKVKGETYELWVGGYIAPAAYRCALMGDFMENGWSEGLSMFESNDDIGVYYKLTFTQQQKIKVKYNGTWYGYDDLDDAVNKEGLGISTDGSKNVVLPAGVYDIYLNNSSKIYIGLHNDGAEAYHLVKVANAGFEDDTEWTKENLTKLYASSGQKHEGSKSFKVNGQIKDTAAYAAIYQNIEGLHAGDKIKVTFWIYTKYNCNNGATPKMDSIKLLAGAQATEMSTVVANSSAFNEYTAEFTLTNADIANGAVKVGVSFLANAGGYADTYIDDFSLYIFG